MSEKMLNTRIQQKHDIEVNWSKAVNFIPKIGEVIIYDPDETYAAARVKIGDGVKTVVELAFIDDAAKAALFKEIDMVDEKVEALGQLVGDASIPEQIEEALLKTQADWNVNDETNAAYVKNRTHYTEAQSYTFTESDYDDMVKVHGDIYKAYCLIQGEFDAPSFVGATITYTDSSGINTCTITEADGRYLWSDGAITLMVYSAGETMSNDALDGSNPVETSGVYFKRSNSGDENFVTGIDVLSFVTLDERYIPLSIARTSQIPEIPQSDWDVFDQDDKAYVKNRPCYYTGVKISGENVSLSTGGSTPLNEIEINYDFIQGATYHVEGTIDVQWPDGTSQTENVSFDAMPEDVYYGRIGLPLNIEIVKETDDSTHFSLNSIINVSENCYGFEGHIYYFNLVYGVTITNLNLHAYALKQLDDIIIPDSIARKEDLVQSDWNENDETALSYVKNRTHYYETEVVLPETLIPGNPQNSGRYFSTFEVIDGADYLITVDGIDYEAKGIKTGDNEGALLPKNDIAEDNQYQWFHIYVESENSDFISKLYAEDNIIEIKLIKKKILEEKYLPTNLKQINSNWNQQDPYQKDYIKERPFYEQYKKVYSLKEQLNDLNFIDHWLYEDIDYYLYRTGSVRKNFCELGKEYLVVYNNQSYTVVCARDENGSPAITLNIDGNLFGLHWEGYTICYGLLTNITPDKIDNIDFVVYDPDEIEIKQLDEKFIPSTIARTADLPVAITSERITEICGMAPMLTFSVDENGDALMNAGWPDDNGNIQI